MRKSLRRNNLFFIKIKSYLTNSKKKLNKQGRYPVVSQPEREVGLDEHELALTL